MAVVVSAAFGLKNSCQKGPDMQLFVRILALVALGRGQETRTALNGLLEAASSVQSSSESFGSSVGSAKEVADYPQEVKEAGKG